MKKWMLTLAALSCSAVALAQPMPLGLPLPTGPTLDALLAPANGSGDGRGILPGAGLCDSTPMPPLSYPAADGPHGDQFLEWWWWNGHLETEDGRRFGFIVYFMSKHWLGLHMMDATILDLGANAFHVRRDPLLAGGPRTAPNGVALRAPGVSADAGGGHDVLHSEVDGWVLDVAMTETKPPSSPLANGFMTFYCNSSYFARRTRMAIEGTLAKNGTTFRVHGSGDFDHQWGFMPVLSVASWKHVTLSLDDGRDIFLGDMVFPTGRDDFSLKLGSITDANGETTLLHRDDYTITPTAYFQRDATCRYPVELDVDIKGEHFTVRPSIRDSELRADNPLFLFLWPENPLYWDGETIIDGAVTGRGWLDLAKFCPL